MKNEYGKQGDKSNSYQAVSNKSDNARKPNAPTQGGFSTPGGGLGQKDRTTQTTKTPQSNTNPKRDNNAWGRDSINKNYKDGSNT